MAGLARLSLRAPVYISVHAKAAAATPPGLSQSLVVVGEEGKADLLWSFLRAHRRKKSLVFFATCRQVRLPSCLPEC